MQTMTPSSAYEEFADQLQATRMRAEVERRYAALLAERAGRLELPAPLTFFDYFDRWIEKEKQKVSVRTGRPLSKATFWTHQAVLEEVRDFGKAWSKVMNADRFDARRELDPT